MANENFLFFIFLLLGIAIGASIGLFNHIVLFFKNNKFLRFVLDLSLPIISGFAFLYLTNKYNMGEIRWFLVLAVIVGIYFERKTIGKLFALMTTKLYNKYVEGRKKFFSSKFGKWLSK